MTGCHDVTIQNGVLLPLFQCHAIEGPIALAFSSYGIIIETDDNISKYGKYGGVKTQVSGEAGLVESKSSKTENQSSVCTGNSILTMQTVKLVNSE